MVYRKAGGSDSRTLSMDAWVRKLGKGLLEYCGGGWISHSPFPFLSADTGREDEARVLVRVFLRALSRIESEFDIAEKVGKTVYREEEEETSKFLYTNRARSIDLLAGFSSLRRRFETPRNRRIRNWNADVLETRILLGNYRERYRVNRSRVGEDVALELAVALLPRSRGGSFDTTPPQFFFPPPSSN